MNEIIKKCKCGVYLEINRHRDYYQSIQDAVAEIDAREIEPELAKRMIDENTIVSLQFYPDTPIGFYIVYGTSLDKVVEKALSILSK